jgi:hypothetical protein
LSGVQLAGEADPPAGHFGLVEDEADGVAGFQRGRAGCTVDVCDAATSAADDLVAVVSHPHH